MKAIEKGMYEAAGKEFKTIEAAKKYVEDLPYWGEAISKGGLIQTIWDADREEVCSRQMVVEGIGANRTVQVCSWYNY